MKKFLSNIGHVFQSALGVIGRINPYLGLLQNFLPNPTPYPGQTQTVIQKVSGGIREALQIIAETEAAAAILIGPTGGGAEKLKLAAPQIGILIEDAIDSLGLQIDDDAAATKSIEGITSNFADLLNACKKK